MTIGGTSFGTDTGSSIFIAEGDLHSSSYIYTGTITTIADTEIVVQFSAVPAGTYVLYVEIASLGFAEPSNNNKDDITVDLVAATTGTTSSYAGGNSLVITGFGFDAATVITVCG